MKLDKIKPIDIEAILARDNLRQRIAQIGLELEGGWDRKTKLSPETRLVPDGSVHVSAFSAEKAAEYEAILRLLRAGHDLTDVQQKRYNKLTEEKQLADQALRVGELPSPILSMKEKDGPLYWRAWLKQFYPSHVNETCGLHVHMSFNRALTYQRCMDPTYPKTIIEYVTRWAERNRLARTHPLWPRVEGKSEYCQHTYYATEQAKEAIKRNTRADHHRPGSRYSVVNYCWKQHHTFEVRLLPMFETVELAESAIAEVLAITNAYLFATRRREDTAVANVLVDSSEMTFNVIERL